MTIIELCTLYLDHALRHRPSYERYRPLRDRILARAEIGRRPVDAIHRYELMALSQAWHRTPGQCKKLIGLIRQAYNWAGNTIDPSTQRPYYDGPNPAVGIQTPTMHSRETLFTERELGLLLHRLDQLRLRHRAFFTARLLVPGRIAELCTMRWEDLAPTGRWTKPTTKNGRPHVTFIPHQALSLLLALPRIHPYVFSGQHGRSLEPASAAKTWREIRAGIGCGHIQLLDFRRTLATYLYRKMRSDDLTAKAILNHFDPRPVAIYTRLDYDYLAGILQEFADWLWTLKEEVHHDTLFLDSHDSHDSRYRMRAVAPSRVGLG